VQHPLAVVVVGGKGDVAGQVVDDGQEPALLEQEIHEVPVPRRQGLLEALQGGVSIEGLFEEPGTVAEGPRGAPEKDLPGLPGDGAFAKSTTSAPKCRSRFPFMPVSPPPCKVTRT
jgi:hypothetical protein